jgi:hypothetical protein
MSDPYLAVADIAKNEFMIERMNAAVTQQEQLGNVNLGMPQVASPFNAQDWVDKNRYVWASSPGWGEKWQYALDSHTDEPDYEPGKDIAVITDEDILATVQALVGSQAE